MDNTFIIFNVFIILGWRMHFSELRYLVFIALYYFNHFCTFCHPSISILSVFNAVLFSTAVIFILIIMAIIYLARQRLCDCASDLLANYPLELKQPILFLVHLMLKLNKLDWLFKLLVFKLPILFIFKFNLLQ